MFKFLRYVLGLLLICAFLQAFSNVSLPKDDKHNKLSFTDAACPTIDISTETIVNPACGQSNGSITGITITSSGTKKTYIWRDSEANIVGHSLDLNNIPAGVYTLEFSDNSGCASSVFSPKIFVQNANAVTIDDNERTITNQSCNNDGSITGIIVTGATTMEWHNTTTGAIVSTSSISADLTGVNAGTYQLYAYNSTCQLTSRFYTVFVQFQVPTVADFKVIEPTCGGQGVLSVELNVQSGQPMLRSYFADSLGNDVADGVVLGSVSNPVLSARNLDGGNYSLFVVTKNNCKALLGTFHLDQGGITIVHSQSIIENDRCNRHLGSIIPIITGGSPAGKTSVTQYTWTDLNTQKVISGSKILGPVGAGTYSLKVVDPLFCTAIDTFTVINIAPSLNPPKAEGTTLCLPGMINITITNPDADTSTTFRLYAALEDSIPLRTNKKGVFYLKVDHTTDFYLARSNGTCESERTKVTEVVVSEIKIPNTFTPNNDGINDYWNLIGIEKFPGADIRVFNRYGQLVFHSVNYSAPFRGTWNGEKLPTGAYYYVIDVKQPICFGKISGSLTIIR